MGAATLTVLAILLRLATAVDVPINPDAAQLVLATSDFDVARHQPHPPGYPIYVGLGWHWARWWVAQPAPSLSSARWAAVAPGCSSRSAGR